MISPVGPRIPLLRRPPPPCTALVDVRLAEYADTAVVGDQPMFTKHDIICNKSKISTYEPVVMIKLSRINLIKRV